MFGAIKNLVSNAKNLQPNKLLENVYELENDKFTELVVTLNTEKQLFEGINSLSIPLSDIGGSYTPFTVQIKQAKAQPFDRVTLRDTGDFYNSFDVSIEKDGFIIESESLKEGIDLTERWGADIVGLTDMSKEALIFFLKPLIVIVLKNELLKNVL